MQDVYTKTEQEIEEFETREGAIDIAWDQKHLRFVAYHEKAKYIGIGVAVNDAKSNFIFEFWDYMNTEHFDL